MKQAVMLISKPGVDVRTATEDDILFDSRDKTLKTKETVLLEPNADPFVHGLGYVPIHLYAGFLTFKPFAIGWIGQNTYDNFTHVVVTDSQISNYNNSPDAASALVYIFWERLE